MSMSSLSVEDITTLKRLANDAVTNIVALCVESVLYSELCFRARFSLKFYSFIASNLRWSRGNRWSDYAVSFMTMIP